MLGVAMVGMWFQDPGSLSSGNSRLLMFFVGLLAVSMVVQVFIVAALAIGAMKVKNKMMAIVDDLHKKSLPIIQSATEIVRDTTPKVKVVTENIVETTHMVRNKVQQFEVTLGEANDTFKEANQKTKAQVSRVDQMVTTALNRTAALGETIHHGIRTPVKQAAGVVSGLRVGFDTLITQFKTTGGPKRPY